MKQGAIILFLCLIFHSPLFSQTDKMSMAIYDLTSFVVDEKEAVKNSERLRFLLSKCNILKVMERNEMESILKEKGFKTNRACNKKKCLLKAGRLLGVDYMASGVIGKIGSSYTISLRMIDVKIGKIIIDEIETCRGGGNQAIPKAINKVANWLAGSLDGTIEKSAFLAVIPSDVKPVEEKPLKTPSAELPPVDTAPSAIVSTKTAPAKIIPEDIEPPTPLQKEPPAAETTTKSNTGNIFVSASKSGSSIKIDGKLIGAKTPVSIDDLPVGEHTISAQLGSWYGSETIEVQPDDYVKVTIDMKQYRGSVKIASNPEGAKVIINKKEYGTTPRRINNIPVGTYVVQVKKEGYQTKEQKITVSPNEVKELSVQLTFSGSYITVKALPSQATILINGKNAGKGTVKLFKVPAGEASLQIKAPGYEKFDTLVTLTTDENKTISKKLISLYGSLEITSKPGKAEVFLNEKKTGKTPYKSTGLKPGDYTLTLRKKGCHELKDNFVIEQNKSIVKNYTLKHTEEDLKSTKGKKTKRKKITQNVRRVFLGGCVIGFASAAIYYNVKLQEALDEDLSPSRVDTCTKRRNVFWICAGGSAVGFALSIPF